MLIYTIGHSTLDIADFCNCLLDYKIQNLVDVRSYPGSRYVPNFNKENLIITLPNYNITYTHLPKLGGRRKSYSNDDHNNVNGWKNQSFKNYASYTLTKEYETGINELIEYAKKQIICIMCAESVPWKCHRSIISNTLVDKGIKVYHIINENQLIAHKINMYGAKAKKINGKLFYPKSDN